MTLPPGASSAPSCDDSSTPTSSSDAAAIDVLRVAARRKPTKSPVRRKDPGDRAPALSLQGPAPAWLIDLVPDEQQRDWVRLVCVACGMDNKGTALAPGFEALGAAFKVYSQALNWQRLAEAGKLIDSVAARAKATVRHQELALPPDARMQPILHAICRARPRSERLGREVRSAQIAQSIVVLDAMRDGTAASQTAIQRSGAMASACRDASHMRGKEDWRDLAKLAPFIPEALKKYLGAHPNGKSQHWELARQLQDAQASDEHYPLLKIRSAPAAGREAESVGSTAAPGQANPSGSTTPTHDKPEEVAAPSVLAAKAAAVYAGMAEQFGVQLVLNRLPPARLTKVTQGCHAALRGPDDTTADQALLLTMAVVICHGFKSTLKLAFGASAGVDIWYCMQDRCVYYDRDVLRGRRPKDGRPNWGTLYVPPEAADRIETLATARESVRQLSDLFSPAVVADMASDTMAWAKTLCDPAHAAWAARVARSAGLAYLEAGASDVESAIFTLNLSLAAPSAPSYYAPDPARQHALAALVLARLGYEAPARAPHANDQADTDVPNDDDIRKEWAAIKEATRAPLQRFPGADVAGVLAATNKAMVGLRRGFELLTGARDKLRENPRFRDVLTSAEWFYHHDKRTPVRSDRLLAMTDALADLVRTARLVRDQASARLLELGVKPENLPPQLVAPDAGASVFVFLHSVARKDGLHVVLRRLEDDDMKDLLTQLWPGDSNMGRRYWVRQASLSSEWMAERVLTGHGRGLNHTGSACLSVPVIELMQGGRRTVLATLERLNLPRLGSALDAEPTAIPILIDLRKYGRRRHPGSAPSDIPAHYCDPHALGAWHVIEAVRPSLGKVSTLSATGRALLGLIAADGLCHTDDLRAAWPCLQAIAKSAGAAWLKWIRPNGQPMAMPMQAPTRLAADEVTTWPTFEEAETELAGWLREVAAGAPGPQVIWPADSHAVVTALCAQAAYWIRLHLAPFLLEAYRPLTLAATLTWASLDQLLAPSLPAPSARIVPFGRRRSQIRAWTDRRSDLARIRAEVGKVVLSTENIGEHKARVKAVLAKIDSKDAESDKVKLHRAQASVLNADVVPMFNPSALTGAAAMILLWVQLECELTYRRGKDPLDPVSIYQYLTRVLARLLKHWPHDLDATTVPPKRWRKITKAILRRDSRESDTRWDNRRIAWQRIVRTLSGSPLHAAAAAALDDTKAGDVKRKYVQAAASTLLTQRHVAQLHHVIAIAFADEPLAGPQAHAMADLLSDPGMRKSEAGVPRLENLSEDGSFIVKFGNGFDPSKTPRAVGPASLCPATATRLVSLRSDLESLHPPHSHFFAEQEGKVDRVYAMAVYDVLVDLTRVVAGTDEVHGHSHRGSAAMRRLVPNWEAVLRRLATGPFELVDALAIVDAMRGAGPEHLATVLCGIGHASHRTFVRRYCTAWPLFYAAAMRAQLATVKLDQSVILNMPHLNVGKTGKEVKAACKRALSRRRTFVYERPSGEPRDDWAWGVRHHFDGWDRDRQTREPDASRPPGGGGELIVEPATPSQPGRETELLYVVLRSLGLSSLAAMVKARIGLSDGARLDSVLAAMPILSTWDGVRQPQALKPKFLKFILRMVSSDVGKALIAAISHTDATVRDVLLGQLADHAGAPDVTPQGLHTVLRALPPGLALEVAMLGSHWSTAVASALAGQEQARLTLLKKRKSQRPRLRVVPHTAGRIRHNHARALTLVTRLCAIGMHQLVQTEETTT